MIFLPPSVMRQEVFSLFAMNSEVFENIFINSGVPFELVL